MKKSRTLAIPVPQQLTPIDHTILEIGPSDPEFAETLRRAEMQQQHVRDRLAPTARILAAHHTLWQRESGPGSLDFDLPRWLIWSGPLAWFAGSIILTIQSVAMPPVFNWLSWTALALCLYAALTYGYGVVKMRRDAMDLHGQFSSPDFDQRLANQAAIATISLRNDLLQTVAMDDLKAMALGLERRREVRARFLGSPSTTGWLPQLATVIAIITATLALTNNLHNVIGLGNSGIGTSVWLLAVIVIGVYGLSLAYWSSALWDSQVWLERKLRAVNEAIAVKEEQKKLSPSANP
jgi:hypothetical protein